MYKLIFSFIILTNISCSESPVINYPYSMIDKKTENDGSYVNKMEIFTTPETINIDTLKMFCIEKKESMTDGTFHYLVFFDSENNATFPNNPMTAFYGIDEEPLKHIRAYFEYNQMNGYSKLNIYESNSWESKATTFDL